MKNKKLLFLAPLLLLLNSCASVVDKNGNILKEKIISLSSAWSFNLGFFDAILIWPISQFINFFSQYIGVIWAIVLITILINLLILPLTIKSQMTSAKMQMLQPRIAKIQEKYKGQTDQGAQMRQYAEVQKLYSEENVKIGSMFVPVFLQLPIMIALWQGIQRSSLVIDSTLFGYRLYLSPLSGMLSGGWIYFIIAFLSIATQILSVKLPQYLSKKYSKKYPNDKPVADQSKGIMNVMIVIMIWFGLSVTSGMGIYLIISSVIRIIQSIYVQNLINNQRGK